MPSTRFLFWNINRKPLADIVADLADADRIDIVILVECDADPGTLLQALNRHPQNGFHISAGRSEPAHVFTRFSRAFLEPTFEGARVSIRRLALPARSEILLAVAHLPSKLYSSGESQRSGCTEVARQIIVEEDKVGHRRTVLVGDLNVNPFEAGVVAADGLHSVASRRVAGRGVRTVQDREYRFFYNPMWAHFGDAKSDTAGSYYYERAEHVNYFWNMFDQVLIRPELAERFDSSQLRIVTSAGTRSLVRPDGRPNSTLFSDHLPIIFELDF